MAEDTSYEGEDGVNECNEKIAIFRNEIIKKERLIENIDTEILFIKGHQPYKGGK